MKKERKNLVPWKSPRYLLGFFFFLFGILYLQLVYLSLSPNIYGINMDDFSKERNTVTETLEAKRGTIYDSDGNVLALNVYSYTVIAYLSESRTTNPDKPNHVVDIKLTAEKLAPILNMEVSYLEDLLSGDGYQVELGPGGREISELVKEEIELLELPGIDFVEAEKRYYPNGDFASYTVGYAKKYDLEVKDQGIVTSQTEILGELGIELMYDDLLKGKDGYLQQQQDRYGYKIPDTNEVEEPAIDGSNVYLTIDVNIQRFIESAVKESAAIYKPESMIITAMDAKTGKILGTTSYPSFDPNIKNITNYENPLTSYLYEPGSTMKIYTYMCTMEKGNYKGEDTFMSGSYVIGDDKVNDWHRPGWGYINYDLGFEYSSNTGIASLLEKFLTASELEECFKEYGFGDLTGIELPRELEGDISFKYPIEVATAGFGQGITTTHIQNLQALTLISNDGKMLTPQIIDKVEDPNTGELTYEFEKKESEQIISQSTVDDISKLMYNTINNNNPGTTGIRYHIDGYDVIGKTGTAQIFDVKNNKYLDGVNNNVFSFAGMFPYEDPEIIIYASMTKPSYSESRGLYTPVTDIIESISKYLNIYEDKFDLNSIETHDISSYINKNVEEVKKDVESKNLKYTILGDGDKVISQYPSKDSLVISNDRVILLTNSTNITMPDIKGYSRSDALNLFELLNMNYTMNGYGFVSNQSIAPGTKIDSNSNITVDLLSKY